MMRNLLIMLMVICLSAALTGGAAAQAVPTPAITITSPLFGAVVTNQGTITVTGIATNLFEGGLAVQALDSAGTVLASQAVIASGAALGGTGTWTANLTVNVAPNTPGRIYAYSDSAQDGSVVAEASVNVTYGTGAPVPTATVPASGAAITITSPVPGAIVPTAGGVVVTGTSRNIFEAQFSLEARDANGVVLAQTGVTATGVESGTWQAVLAPVITTTTPGSIVAYDTGGNGQVVASTVVNVTFVPNCAPRTDWPTYQIQVGDNLFRIAEQVGSTMNELALANCLANPSVILVGTSLYVPRLPGGGPVETATIAITAPVQGATIPPGTPITITGTGGLAAAGNVVVEARDYSGRLLAQRLVTATADQWTAQLMPDVPEGLHGVILAYPLSRFAAGDSGFASVPVVFGAVSATQPSVSILSPLPGNALTGAISVQASNVPPGGVVVVELLDAAGSVLIWAPSAQTVDGSWSATLTINPALLTGIGSVAAYFTDPATGSVLAYDRIPVRFGP